MGQAGSRLWVWAEALHLLQGMEQRQRLLFAIADAQAVPCWAPLIDAYERNGELQLVVALPGVDAEKVEVVLDENRLVVRGQRPIAGGLHRAAIHRLEIPYGSFERRIALPAGNFQIVSELMENGCLTLTLRRV